MSGSSAGTAQPLELTKLSYCRYLLLCYLFLRELKAVEQKLLVALSKSTHSLVKHDRMWSHI